MTTATVDQATVESHIKATSSFGSRLSGKYMTFRLAKEVYGLELLKVREIIGMMEITGVARTADYIRGVINLRGKVIPVLDQKQKLGLGETEVTEQTVIIVVQMDGDEVELTMGMLVDEVLEVVNIPEGRIEAPPDFGEGGIDLDFILGVGKLEKDVVFLLDIRQVPDRKDFGAFDQSIEA